VAVQNELQRLLVEFDAIATDGKLGKKQFSSLFAELSVDLQQIPHELAPVIVRSAEVQKDASPAPKKETKAWWAVLFSGKEESTAPEEIVNKESRMVVQERKQQEIPRYPERVIVITKNILRQSLAVQYGYFGLFENKNGLIEWPAIAATVQDIMTSSGVDKMKMEFLALKRAGERDDQINISSRSLQKCIREPYEVFMKELLADYLFAEFTAQYPSAPDTRVLSALNRLKPIVSSALMKVSTEEFEELVEQLGLDMNSRLVWDASKGACVGGGMFHSDKEAKEGKGGDLLVVLDEACLFPSTQSLRTTARLLGYVDHQLYGVPLTSKSDSEKAARAGLGRMTLAQAMQAEIASEISAIKSHLILGCPLIVVGGVGVYITSMLFINPSQTLAVMNMLGPLQSQARLAMQRFGGFTICFLIGGIKELVEAGCIMRHTSMEDIWGGRATE
jgi:hypothetical protein